MAMFLFLRNVVSSSAKVEFIRSRMEKETRVLVTDCEPNDPHCLAEFSFEFNYRLWR